jgi:hypothetical protein
VNTALRPPKRRSVSPARVTLAIFGVAVPLCVAVIAARLGAGEPRRFTRLTVENSTPYVINVEVTAAGDDTWLDVGSFRREGRRTVEELADQGARWAFRFSYGGVVAGQVSVTRGQLASDGWTLSVPAAVADRLRAEGLPESAR